MDKAFTITILMLFLLPTGGLAEVIDLDQIQMGSKAEYKKALDRVSVGDHVLCNGIPQKIVSYLGSGNTAHIFEIENGLVLRVPLSLGQFYSDTTYQDFLNETLDISQKLKDTDLPFPRVRSDLSRRESCIVVEKFVRRFSLADMQRYQRDKLLPLGPLGERISFQEVDLASQEFSRFAKLTWQIGLLGDVTAENIVWTTNGWMIADFAGGVELVGPYSIDTLFIGAGIPLREKWKFGKLAVETRFQIRKMNESERILYRQSLKEFHAPRHMHLRALAELTTQSLGAWSEEELEGIPRDWLFEKIFDQRGGLDFWVALPRDVKLSIKKNLIKLSKGHRFLPRLEALALSPGREIISELRCAEIAN